MQFKRAHKTYSAVNTVPKVLTEAQLSGSLQTGQNINNLEQGTLQHKEGDGLYGLPGLFRLSSL